jgi:hypothetical protein
MITARRPKAAYRAPSLVAFVAISVAFVLLGPLSTLGYVTREKKIAWLLAPGDESGVAFRVAIALPASALAS